MQVILNINDDAAEAFVTAIGTQVARDTYGDDLSDDDFVASYLLGTIQSTANAYLVQAATTEAQNNVVLIDDPSDMNQG